MASQESLQRRFVKAEVRGATTSLLAEQHARSRNAMLMVLAPSALLECQLQRRRQQ